MKKILGLDLGTNSIGWALVDPEDQKILGMGSRIIPMGTDKQDYEKGIGITKNADRRAKRTIRKMNKRYKLRRNKLLYVLHELGMLPEQFQFKNGIPKANKIQELDLLPIKKGQLQLDALSHYRLRASALKNIVDLKNFGKILYKFNQLRGYAGGNDEEDIEKNKDEPEEENVLKKYEVITQKVEILKVEKSDKIFKIRGGANKGQELNKFHVTILLNEKELEGETELQDLMEGKEEDLEIRIKRSKKGEPFITFSLAQKTNWRKQLEATEDILKTEKLFVSELILKELEQKNKWIKIRNRVILRNRYQQEFDAIWDIQSKYYSILNNCSKEKLEKIAWYIFPGESDSQEKLRNEAVEGGLKHIIRNQIIYYQRPLKSQTDLISKCQFERDQMGLANSHPLFQEFRCWDQINRLYITSKEEVWNEKKKRNVFQFTDRFLTNEEKLEIYTKLQNQKQLGYSEVIKIIKVKNDKTEYLNGLNSKAKLKGAETIKTIKDRLGDQYIALSSKENNIIEKIWQVLFENANNGNEYDPESIKVSSIIDVLAPLDNKEIATELALNLAQNIKFPRKYASLSAKAIHNILPLMRFNPTDVTEKVKTNFSNIKHLIETGEVLDENLLEDYIVSFVKNNPDAIENGGLMYAFASSLVYGKHTKEKIKPQIKNYHDIQYLERNLRNPIVSQLANETMQIIKALWKQYSLNPEEIEIRVELARDLKNSATERDKIYKGQIKSQKINDDVKKRLQVEGIPTTERNILKYKLYEQQNFMSPYTKNKIIPFSSLFDDRLYDIDHIIPKSRYFDDSLSNKILCETNINEEKGNRTAWEYISQQNSRFAICSEAEFVSHVNDTFFGRKKKNLLLEKIPNNPIERQLKDTQYISVALKNELAKVVGSDNVKTSTGEVTSFLRSRWGLRKLFMELTEERFRQMELWDHNPKTGKPHTEWVQKYFDKEKNIHIYEIKNWSKRYDHRHHAIDALVVALTEQKHIKRLNDLNKYLQDELTKRKDEFKLEIQEGENILDTFFNLEFKRRDEIQRQIGSSRHFDLPFNNLVKQAKAHLESMIVSIKPKDKISISADKYDKNTPYKNLKTQIKLRGALHQETYYGKTKDPKSGFLRDTKTIDISKLADKDVSNIIDQNVLATEIENHRKKYDSMKEALTGEGLKAFNASRFQTKQPEKLKPPVYKVKVWYSSKETMDSTLQRLYENNEKQSVVTGDNYLFLVMEKEDKNGRKRVFDIASLYDSSEITKQSLKEKDENFKAKICEDYRIKHKEKPQKVLFTLQQGDLVYFPEDVDDMVINFSNSELNEWLTDDEKKKAFSKRVYKAVMFTGKDCKFIPHNYANSIIVPKDLTDEQNRHLKDKYESKKSIPKNELNFVEFGSYRDCSPYPVGDAFIKNLTVNDKKEKVEIKKIQESCIKLKTDWLGHISKA